MHRKCMVIDLDETLVHSSFKVSNYISFDHTVLIKNIYFFDNLTAHTECRLHSSGGDRWDRTSGVCSEATARGRVSAEDGRTVRVRFVYSITSQICRSSR